MKLKPSTLTSGRYGSYLFGRAVYPPGGRYGPRRQRAYQLVILTQGSLRLLVDDTLYQLKPGQALLLKPDGLETYAFSNSLTSVHLWCEAAATHFLPQQLELLRSCSGVHAVAPFTHLLIEQGLKNKRAKEDLSDCAFSSLAASCLLYSALENASQAQVLVRHPVVRQAMEIASVESASLISVAQWAKRLGISATHLRALFQHHLRESPSTFLWRHKTERAIQLLRSTGLTLKEVADQCGFADAFHLSRRVKKLAGESPRQLRQREWSHLGFGGKLPQKSAR